MADEPLADEPFAPGTQVILHDGTQAEFVGTDGDVAYVLIDGRGWFALVEDLRLSPSSQEEG